MDEIVKHALLIFPFLLEEDNESFKKSKGGCSKIFYFRLMFVVKNFNEILSES